MRLPWPFGRAQRSANADGGATPDGPSESLPERASGDAWRHLPPLAETVGPPPLVAPNRPFAAALASNEPPAPILAPLSHGRSLEAPRGLVSGIARPTATAPGPALPAPVQRSPLGARRAGAGADFTPEPWGAADADADAGAHAHAVGPSPVPEPTIAPGRPPVPIRRLEAVPDAARTRPPLTRAPEASRPATPAGVVGQPRAPGAAAAKLTLGASGVQRSPATPEPAAPQVPPTPDPGPAMPPAPLPAAPRLTIGQARRLGLGAPVAGGPVGASTPVFTGGAAAGTRAASSSAPGFSAAAAGGAIQRSPQPGAPEMPLASQSAAGSRSDAAGPEPAPEPERAPTPTRLPEPSPGAPAVIARPIADVAERRPPSMASARIVSSTPLRTRVQRAPLTISQRAPDDATAGGASPTSTPAARPTAGGPVKVHRDSEASQLSSALDARSFTHGGEIFLPSSHGPLTSGKGKALLAHEMTHVAQQRRLGSSLPQEHTSHGQSLEAEAVAAERAPEMPLAQAQKEAPAAAPSPITATSLPAGHAAGDGHAHGPAMTGGVQRAPAREKPGEAPRQRPEDKPQPTDRELEDLAQKLYARIGRQLRRELLVDRERAGMAVDLVR